MTRARTFRWGPSGSIRNSCIPRVGYTQLGEGQIIAENGFVRVGSSQIQFLTLCRVACGKRFSTTGWRHAFDDLLSLAGPPLKVYPVTDFDAI